MRNEAERLDWRPRGVLGARPGSLRACAPLLVGAAATERCEAPRRGAGSVQDSAPAEDNR